jgi:anaerobic selenocysteine-containing dehydrogenase
VEFDEYAYRATPLCSQVPGLARLESAAGVALNTADAEALGVESGAAVRVTSSRGSVVGRAQPSERIQQGVVSMVSRGGEGSPAAVLDLLLDPITKAPEEICAVRIERL